MTLQLGRYLILLLCCFVTTSYGQVVYYPSNSSDLLKSTAQDVADVFTKAIPGSNFVVQQYNNSVPQSGIIFSYDSIISQDQSCKIEGNLTCIKFSSARDNGLCFGTYKYLNSLGFRFYLPGSIWEKIPILNSPFQNINIIVQGTMKYNNWNISGGHNRWAMDNDGSYSWDTYFGKNGHEWAKYQRRNNMAGFNRFSGHRGDIYTVQYINTLQANPCYVACYNQSRQPGMQAVPDINNTNAKDLWASSISNQYSSFKNIIMGNPTLYANYYHNFNFNYGNIGIEVPDGAHWGNSTDSINCSIGNYNGNPYPKQSDQHFLLANYSTQKMIATFPGKRFQCYAYSGHADIPSPLVGIQEQIDVQVIPGAFQFETSAKALLNRWYNAHFYISEYHYLNIPQWTGETPMFSLDEFKNTWRRIREKNAQGLIVESSPAKFASLPYLFAGNRYLGDNNDVDSTLDEMVKAMFPGEVGIHIRKLLKYFGDDKISTIGNFISDNKFKIPLYLDELNKAVIAANDQNPDPLVPERLQEIKAYLHYLILHYDFINTPGSYESKSLKAAALCIYLARINRLQLVNSFYLIQDIVSKYPSSHNIHNLYNVVDGNAYANGNMPLLTGEEINATFSSDITKYLYTVTDFKFEDPLSVVAHMDDANLKTMDSIHVKIAYTNGYEYPNRSEFYFFAPTAGTLAINCTPQFGMPGGFINISVEADDKPLMVLKDVRINSGNNPGLIPIDVPSMGIYKLSIVSKFKASADLLIYTKGNIFYKKGPFYGDKVESYRDDTTSFPKYIYVPANTSRLFFSVNNACTQNNCLTSSQIADAFAIRNDQNQLVNIIVSPSDSSLFYVNVPNPGQSHFWEVTKMREYNLCFANISNMELFAKPRECNNVDFSATIILSGGECHTRITSKNESSNIRWQITDGARSYSFSGIKRLDLPVILSPGAIIEMKSENGCRIHKKASEITGYLNSINVCALAGQSDLPTITVYPNPSSGVFTFIKNNSLFEFNDIKVYGAMGQLVAQFENTNKINLSSLPSGLYIVTGSNGKDLTRIKLVKL